MDPLFPEADTPPQPGYDYLPPADVLVPADGQIDGRHTLYDLRVYAELRQARDVLALSWGATRIVGRLGFSACCLARLPEPMPADGDLKALLREPKLRALLERVGFANATAVPLISAQAGPQLLLLLNCRGETDTVVRVLATRRRVPLRALARAITHLCLRRFPSFALGLGNGGDKTLIIVPELLELLSLLSRDDLRIKDAGARQGHSLRSTRRRLTLLRRTLGTRTVCGGIGVAMDQGLI